eukprot:7472288-Pyramimonas_sp.AAC.1
MAPRMEVPAKDVERSEIVDPDILQEALSAGPGDTLSGHLWTPVPEQRVPPLMDEFVEYLDEYGSQEPFTFGKEDEVFFDGSCFGPKLS